MAWPWHIVDLDDQQKALRRDVLDRYGIYGQLSAVIPVLAYQLYRLCLWVLSERKRVKTEYSEVPSSPNAKRTRRSWRGFIGIRWRRTVWWLEDEPLLGWESRGLWIGSFCWTIWLLFLSTHKTGEDYMHLTKRFGIVGISQLPVHYMLSMKSLYSPLAIAFGTSHEKLNSYHRFLGRIVYFILLMHALNYLNAFFQLGILSKLVTALVPFLGLLALIFMTTVALTSFATVRQWSYRLFFFIHVVIGVSILPILFFHANALRIYVIEAFVLFGLDLAVRKYNTFTSFSEIVALPDTGLLKLTIPVPKAKMHKFHYAPGQHVYLSLPAESAPNTGLSAAKHGVLFNPFTVAEATPEHIVLVIRALNGPTTIALKQLTRLSKAKPPLNVEGPYGSSRTFPNLALQYDRIVLVAGGVGATFILPIYHHIRSTASAEGISADRVHLVWSVRKAADAAWANKPDEESLLASDKNVKLFITGSDEDPAEPAELSRSSEDGDVEMEDLQKEDESLIPGIKMQRPDLNKTIDDVFRLGNEERIAVLVCGPAGMAHDLRRHVGKWVAKGRYVWWHDESFGL